MVIMFYRTNSCFAGACGNSVSYRDGGYHITAIIKISDALGFFRVRGKSAGREKAYDN